MATECSVHHVPLELVPAEPRSRCPNCHFMTHHLHFERCNSCGTRMEIEQPEPEWQCPLCRESAQRREEATAAA